MEDTNKIINVFNNKPIKLRSFLSKAAHLDYKTQLFTQ